MRKQIAKWAVGITTAPRSLNYLPRTLNSLIETGFNELTVFAEPKSNLSGLPSCDVVQNKKLLGIHHNYVETLRRLLVRNPEAQAIMIVQDDVVFCKNVREHLERDLWPTWNTGVVSAYSANWNGYERDMKDRGIRKVNHSLLVGACAFIFPREVVKGIVNHPLGNTWRGRARARSKSKSKVDKKAADAFVGTVIKKMGLHAYFYVPSMVQHIAKVSSVNHGGNKGLRKSVKFVGEETDARTIYPQPWIRYDLPSKDQRFRDARPMPSIEPVKVVIPAVENEDLTIKCLAHIAKNAGCPVEIVYVDNGSKDCTIEEVEFHADRLGLKIETIRNPSNYGFTRAINQGLHASRGHHVLVLNNDCFVGPNCIVNLKKHLEWHPRIAAVGPMTGDNGNQSWQKNQKLRRHCHLKKTPDLSNPDSAILFQREWIAEVDRLSFFCAMLHRDAIEELGGLDRSFESGLGADDEWCLRAKSKRWKTIVAMDAFAVHLHSQTFKRLKMDRKGLQKEAVRHLNKMNPKRNSRQTARTCADRKRRRRLAR